MGVHFELSPDTLPRSDTGVQCPQCLSGLRLHVLCTRDEQQLTDDLNIVATAIVIVGTHLVLTRLTQAVRHHWTRFRMNRMNARRGSRGEDGFSFLTALKMAAGGGLGTGGGNPFWSFVWFLGLLFVGYPIAGFCAGWYILILPFGVCFDGFSGICEMLLKGVQAPHFCAKHMMDGTSLQDAFK